MSLTENHSQPFCEALQSSPSPTTQSFDFPTKNASGGPARQLPIRPIRPVRSTAIARAYQTLELADGVAAAGVAGLGARHANAGVLYSEEIAWYPNV